MNDFLIILSLIIIEGILSVDNAVVLATMVKHLPKEKQKKALRYGILWAYLFRGIFLVFAFVLVKIVWIKLVWWAYLLYLTYKHFFMEEKEWEESKFTKATKTFWGTVVMVEVADIVFSLDNVLSAVAMSNKLLVIMTGVFIGILAMRFVAWAFISILDKHPQLLSSAYIVIGLLWAKLVFSFIVWIMGLHNIEVIMENHTTQAIFALVTILIFLFPIVKKKCLNFSR